MVDCRKISISLIDGVVDCKYLFLTVTSNTAESPLLHVAAFSSFSSAEPIDDKVRLTGFHQSRVQLPIPTERSLLDLLLAKQEVQRPTDRIPVLSKLCCQIILANHHLPARVAAMDAVSIA